MSGAGDFIGKDLPHRRKTAGGTTGGHQGEHGHAERDRRRRRPTGSEAAVFPEAEGRQGGRPEAGGDISQRKKRVVKYHRSRDRPSYGNLRNFFSTISEVRTDLAVRGGIRPLS